MFNLEQSIARWRQQMLAAGIQSSAQLDELEGHLREEIERQTKSGAQLERAFDLAVLELGKANTLKKEFKKIGRPSAVTEKWMIGIGLAFIALIAFLGRATVVMCFDSLGDRLMAAAAMICTVGVAWGWRYAVPHLPLIASAPKRIGLGLSVIAFGLVAANIYCEVIMRRLAPNPDHHIPAIGLWIAFLVALFCCLGVGICLSAGDRERYGMNRRNQFTATT